MASRKPRAKRPEPLKSYYAAWPDNAVEQLQAAILKYKTRYKYVKVGITTDPKQTFTTRLRCDEVSWQRMALKYRTDNALIADKVRQTLVNENDWITTDDWKVPTTLFDRHCVYYLYFLLGRRKKTKDQISLLNVNSDGLPEHEPLRLFEGFAGYGGATFGLRRAGVNHEVVGFSEFDNDAIELYEHNFPGIKNFGDITQINPYDLPDFDLFTGGFPCQPFSTVGKRKGQLDERGRGTLFGEIIRICEAKRPKYILLENVKGLTLGKMKNTYEIILSELHRLGYDVRSAVLNSKDYGIPQNRERLWIFGCQGELPDNFEMVPPKKPLQGYLSDFLDKNPDAELYRTQEQINRIHELHGNDVFDVQEPLCYDIYNRKIRKDRICMTVTPPEHNVIRIIEPMVNGEERFRKLSLDEHFRLMGFRIDEKEREIQYPPTQNYTKLGRKAGNGWDVNLVGILFNHIFKQLL